ncbi:RNA polymerase sigma factor [Flavihumibacter petaseus]|uniref:Putative RNA polymerase ECF-type sigma factor n=1 Tax=Flavihumibacter petaseus NBRC 106054 TaxID=1220578 RepID=A0A0E9N4R3_9BACT|nr:sigma-70 family RNA polymerase sigma factor [Flavihumibacter petaseus]GAO44937.1 putative RNA polymerase ECF-type sigma factor [Flavihumibacter petaseus NBRC 106054]
MNEAEFIERLQQGDETAFRMLVEEWKDRVYNIALGLVHREDEAADITQDVFVSIFRRIGKFRADAELGTWIYRITVNRSLDLIRQRKRREWLGQWIDFFHPGVQLEKKQDAALLFAAIKKLPEQQQAAYQLQQLEGLRQADIAAILEISEGAVESLLSRARANLRKTLKAHFDEKGK